jgi:hypothetical protein
MNKSQLIATKVEPSFSETPIGMMKSSDAVSPSINKNTKHCCFIEDFAESSKMASPHLALRRKQSLKSGYSPVA